MMEMEELQKLKVLINQMQEDWREFEERTEKFEGEEKKVAVMVELARLSAKHPVFLDIISELIESKINEKKDASH